MPTLVSLKNSLLMLLGGLVCAVGMAFLFNFLFSGPKLGPHYDFLVNMKNPSVTREILIINTEEYIEGSDFFLILMTLTEMEASNLILTNRLSSASSPITLTDAEIRRRFYEEYLLVGSNIRNLFEGIRMGLVTPLQAPLFVERLIELTEQGRDRLITTLIERDEDLIRSVTVFGNFIENYSRPLLDKDGVLRRVKPVLEGDENIHPVYQHLMNRFAVSRVETSGEQQILWLRTHDGKNMDLLLDSDGNIITYGTSAFRRIDIELFREYEEKGNALFYALALGYESGAFSKTLPEKIPLFLGEYAQVLLNELLAVPSDENRSNWIIARNDYYKNLNDYFESEMDLFLISEYEENIADTDPSNTIELENLIRQRDELRQSSVLMREIYNDLSVIYAKLKDELTMSLCIMGSVLNADYSALLANSIITGTHVKPVNNQYVLFLAIISSFIILLIIFLMRPFILLGIGFVLSVLSCVFSSLFFVYFSYWIDPVIIFGASFSGVLIVFYCKLTYLNYRALNFRSAYRAVVPKNILSSLIKRGKPGLSEVSVSNAAIIAIKDNNLFNRENNEVSKDAGKVKRTFYAMVKKAVFNAGAVIVGFEGDTVLVCFGSPLELKPTLTTYKWAEDGKPLAKTYHPVEKACALVKQLLKNDKVVSWRFGIDAGECSFSWSPETGFSVSGRPAVRARLLVLRTSRYRVRALVTESIKDKIELDGKKAGTLHDDNDWAYELLV